MKEIIFIVTWTLITIVPSIEKPTIDEYGRAVGGGGYTLAVYKFSTVEKEMSKEFKTEKEADLFIKKMPIEPTFMMGDSYCVNPIKQKVIKEIIKPKE